MSSSAFQASRFRTGPARPRAHILILADYHLGDEESGSDAIRAVRSRLGRNIPAAIITGDTSPKRILEVNASGFTLLHKPLDPRELLQLLNA